ncbi:uncharacterized protein LOC103117290 [Erinaceus europaeus]|uniref:Uncharacterized protein LOC103117290 n=1 Tax=Erinaceus europaeus TaxID=9365 RepID=A0A1S3A0C1_ERIEU|nr:uncharacterized protein LOC103117290 [Erinaceus europaeus]
MEATKKVGGPDPSGPQGHSSVSSQELGTDPRGPQGSWINTGPIYFRQGLSLSSEAIINGACGPVSKAHAPGSIHQLLQDPATVSAQYGSEKASQDALRLSSTNLFPSPILGAHSHLVMERETLALPVCTHSDNTSTTAQYGPYRSQLQVLIEGQSKTPAKVLVGWGRGPCSPEQTSPLAIQKNRWLPCFLSGADDSAATQGPLLAPGEDKGEGKCPCPVAAPSDSTQANTPALDTTPNSGVIESYTCNLNHVAKNITITKTPESQDLLLRRCGNHWSILMESPHLVSSCQDKEHSHSQEESPTQAQTPQECSNPSQELNTIKSKELESPVEKVLACTSVPGSPMSCEKSLDTPKKSCPVTCRSQPDQQPLEVCNNTSSSERPSAYQAPCQKQLPVPAPEEPTQVPSSFAPAYQLQNAVEDHVLVFDMATGNTRVGLLCHDPMGSRAVLVGLMPSIYVAENVLSTQPVTMPILSPDNSHSNYWSTSPMISSPVPSSISSGSYREVTLMPKAGRLHLEPQNFPGSETPIRAGMLPGPVPLGMPLQFGERILSHAHNSGWSEPDAEKNESPRTIWTQQGSRMQDTSAVREKKLQWASSELTLDPATLAKSQEVPKAQLQEDSGSCKQKEDVTIHSDSTRARAEQPSPGEKLAPAREMPLASLTPPNGQCPSAEQPPPTQQSLLPNWPCLPGPHLAKQLSFTAESPCPESPFIRESVLSSGVPTTTEPGQPSTLCPEGKPLDLPTHVGILRTPLVPEEACVYVSRDKASLGDARSSSTPRVSWQPDICPSVQQDQLSLITLTTPDAGCKVLPLAVVGPETQGPQFKLTAKDITHSSVVAHLGLLRGACYELVSPVDVLPMQSSVICRRHTLGPYQGMAAVVIDTGTGFTKCGLAGGEHVLSVLPSRVQLLQHQGQGQPRYTVPANQEGSYSVLNRGVVSDWDALEVLWQHLFYCRLGMQPEKLAVLVADSPISPRTNREKVAEILFERFHVPAMQTVHQALLALYAYGRTSGLVVGSGQGTSYVAPILTGHLAPLDTYRLDVAGCDLTESLAQLLLAGGHSPLKTELVNQIKETCCYVAMDMAAEMARTQSCARVDFVLPDKQVITLGSERFCCPEALFQPSLLGVNQPGLPQLALLSISRLEAKQQEQLLANVVLDGGSTLVNGFPGRLRRELGPHATVLGAPHRAVAACLGGSIMASRDSFQSLWLSRREYEEEGPWAIYKYRL